MSPVYRIGIVRKLGTARSQGKEGEGSRGEDPGQVAGRLAVQERSFVGSMGGIRWLRR